MLRPLLVIIAIICSPLVGCIQHQLRINSVKQSETVVSILHQQVVDNVATFLGNPDSVPSLAVPTGASNQVIDNYSASATPTFLAFAYTPWILNFNPSRNFQENWTLDPVMQSDRLARMRCAFQIVVGAYDPCASLRNDTECIQCTAELAHMGLLPLPPIKPHPPTMPLEPKLPHGITEPEKQAFAETFKSQLADYRRQVQDFQVANVAFRQSLERYPAVVDDFCQKAHTQVECHFPRGWYGVAERRCDVPKSACYVAKGCGKTFVYVTPDGYDALARFTLTVLTLAASDPPPPDATYVRRYSPSGDILETSVTTQEDFVPPTPSGSQNSMTRSRNSRDPDGTLRRELRRDTNSGTSGLRGLIQLHK